MIDFARVAAAALAAAETLVPRWLPDGRRHGREWKCGDLSGSAGDSCSVNLQTGAWADFATGERGGDLVSLYAGVMRLSQADAARALAAELGLDDAPTRTAPPVTARGPLKVVSRSEWTPILPAPADAGSPPAAHPVRGRPSHVWTYRDGEGRVLGYTYRFTQSDGGKEILPLVFASHPQKGREWRWLSFPAPRPLYGLDALRDGPVLVVEGEKCADVARAELGSWVSVVSWAGGSNAVDKADWSPLRGREVMIWPDCDAPGHAAAKKVSDAITPIGAAIAILDVPLGEHPEGWDVADCVMEGVRGDALRRWIEARRRPVAPSVPASQAAGSSDPHRADGRDWPAPLDLFAKYEPPRLPADCLPEVLENFVLDQAEVIGTDPALLALSSIVACAALIHDETRIQPKRRDPTWTESARLWGAIVGDPSIKKTPAMSKAISPLRALDAAAHEERSRRALEHEIEEKIYAKREREYVDKRSRGESADAPVKPERPPNPRVLVEDVTIEALSDILRDNARGVLCLSDELSTWFGSMDAYNNSKTGGRDRGNWLEIYNGGPRRIDRISRGTIFVPNWSACMLGGIQPAVIRDVAARLNDDGLLQRFMVVVGRPTDAGVDRLPNMAATNAYRELVSQLWGSSPAQDVITLSPGAAEVREELADYVRGLVRATALPAGLTSHLGKWEGLFPRLLLTFHCIEAAARKEYPPPEVERTTAERVARFMREFLLGHALTFYLETLDARDQTDNVRWICGFVLAKQLSVLTLRDLQRSWKKWAVLKEWERRDLLRTLVEACWLEPAGDERDQLSSLPPRYWVNPRAHALYAGEAERQRKKRAAMVAMIAERLSRHATRTEEAVQ